MAVASWALLTLQEGKDCLGEVGDEFNSAIEELIDDATLACEGYTDRLLKSRTYTNEVYDGDGSLELTLRQYPITACAAVEFLTFTPPDVWTSYDATTYGLHVVEPVKDTIAFRSLCFPLGAQSVRVPVYTAGYTSIPAQIKKACRIVLAESWLRRDRQNGNIASQTFPGGQSVTYRPPVAVPADAAQRLEPYRRWCV